MFYLRKRFSVINNGQNEKRFWLHRRKLPTFMVRTQFYPATGYGVIYFSFAFFSKTVGRSDIVIWAFLCTTIVCVRIFYCYIKVYLNETSVTIPTSFGSVCRGCYARSALYDLYF